MSQREKRSTIAKPRSKKTAITKIAEDRSPRVECCDECRKAGTVLTTCACKAMFCKHTILDHQKKCISYRRHHAMMRRNAIARQLATPITETDVQERRDRIVERLNLLSEAMVLLLEAVARK